jgi:hypothetical protein
MFSLLRAGLKFTQALSDDVVKSVAADFSKSMMNVSARRWSSTGPSISGISTVKIAAAKMNGDKDADGEFDEIGSRSAWN